MMRIRLIAVAQKLPTWIAEGVKEYLKRLHHYSQIEIITIAPAKRSSNTTSQLLKKIEGEKILQTMQPAHYTIALEVSGKEWDTEKLARQIETWQLKSLSVDFIIGGADGLANEVLQQAQMHLSLSRFTFPHAFVQVLVLEQLYRAFCIINHHPYHRK